MSEIAIHPTKEKKCKDLETHQDNDPYLSIWKLPFAEVEAALHVHASISNTTGLLVGAFVVGTGVGAFVVGTGVGTGVGDFVVGNGVGGFDGSAHSSTLWQSS